MGVKVLRSHSEFLRHFWQLAIVNILSNLMVPLAGLMDVAFLGHLAEIRHLAGVALATVLFNYIYYLTSKRDLKNKFKKDVTIN